MRRFIPNTDKVTPVLGESEALFWSPKVLHAHGELTAGKILTHMKNVRTIQGVVMHAFSPSTQEAETDY